MASTTIKFKKIIDQFHENERAGTTRYDYRPEYEVIVDGEVIGKVFRMDNGSYWKNKATDRNVGTSYYYEHTRQEAGEALLQDIERAAAKAEVV
jgi:hypothetical protein